MRGRAATSAAVVAVPTVIAGVLCAVQLGTRSLWLDEAATVSIVSQHGSALWSAIAHDGGNMLLYYLLMHLVVAWFGDAEAVLRVWSAVAVALSAGLTAWLGVRLFSRRLVGLAAGVLFAVSLPIVYWGQTARGYAPMVLLSTAAFCCFAAMLEPRGPGSPVPPARWPVARWAPVGYTLCTVAALYVGYDAGLLVLAQLVVVWVCRRELLGVVLRCLVVAAVCCIPLAVLAVSRGSGQLFWVPPVSGHVLGPAFVTLVSAGMPPNFHSDRLTTWGTVFGGAVLVWAVSAGLRRSVSWQVRMCVWWVVVPVIVGLLAAVAGQPIELARCALLVMPGMALLVAWALLSVAPVSVAAGRGRAIGLAVLCVLLAVRLVPLARSYGVSPEDWRSATRYVVAGAGVGSAAGGSTAAGARARGCVLFYPQDGRMPFDYYVRRSGSETSSPVSAWPALRWGVVRPFVEQYAVPAPAQLRSIAAACPRLWLVASHQGQLRNASAQSVANYHRYQRLVASLTGLYGPSHVKRFGYAATVYVETFSRR